MCSVSSFNMNDIYLFISYSFLLFFQFLGLPVSQNFFFFSFSSKHMYIYIMLEVFTFRCLLFICVWDLFKWFYAPSNTHILFGRSICFGWLVDYTFVCSFCRSSIAIILKTMWGFFEYLVNGARNEKNKWKKILLASKW